MGAPSTAPDPSPQQSSTGQRRPPGFHGAVSEFKRRLIEATLTQLGGNRTQAARALGLQRTYLLRLIREFGVNVPRRGAPVPVRAPEGRAAGERGRGDGGASTTLTPGRGQFEIGR
jgi:hypothetical protein